MANCLDPDQAPQIVGPDLGPNGLPMCSVNNTGRSHSGRLRVNHSRLCYVNLLNLFFKDHPSPLF